MEHTAAIYLNKIEATTSQVQYENDGLFGGKLGLVWQNYYLWQATREYAHKEACLRVLGEVFDNLNNDTPQLSGAAMSGGAAGFGYVVTHLHRAEWLDFDLNQTLADLDEFIYESALEHIQQRKLDFWHGAFGMLFYFLERLPHHRQRAEVLIQKIVEQVQGDDDGLWFPNVMREEDEPIINFSLSHGQTAFMLVLMQAAQKGIEEELVRSVVARGVNFLLRHERTVDYVTDFSYFPLCVHANTAEPRYNNRLAVCYGDLNLVLLMYKAAAFFDNAALKKRADLLGLNTLRRQNEQATLVSDSHFCHGAAGVAQFYHSLYRISGQEGYYKGYQYWIDRTIAALHQDLATDAFRETKGGLVSGYAGVALVLLTYIYHQRERLYWEKVFLL